MGGLSGVDEKDYVLMRDFKVELGTCYDDGGGGVEEDGNGCFTLCFWLYIHNCASFPAVILVQKQPDATSTVPFLLLDEKKKMKLFPLLFLHEEAPNPDNSISCTGVQCASAEIECPIKKWVHVGCEVLSDLIRLHVDGEIVGEMSIACPLNNKLRKEAMKRIHLACLDENGDIFNGYVHGLDVLFPASSVRNHYIKDPPMRLSIDRTSASEIEEDSDGVWSIVGGKASCRRSFSLDVTLLDALGDPVNRELEVVASLLYADNEVPVEKTNDAEPPLLTSHDGIEYASHDRPCKLINGHASLKLKISQLSSKCNNRLFRIRFDIPKLRIYRFLEALSPPIHCVSRNKNVRTGSVTWGKSSNRIYYTYGCGSPGIEDGSMELIPNIVREAKPSPSSKRIKLGHRAHEPHAWTAANVDNTRGISMCGNAAENNSSASDNSEARNCEQKSMVSVLSPITDLIVFKYCLGGPAERCHLLKELSISSTEEQLADFAKQVSLFSGCLHHRHQIKIAKGLIEEGIQAWTLISENNNHVMWENLILCINECFMKIACSSRSLTDQDFECLRRIAGSRDLVSQEDFERLWCWLYPVAFTLSQNAINAMWDSMSPKWMEGFITKEEAESRLESSSGGLQHPGTFVLRFPTSRSWPHPDAGNLVVTYVGGDYTIHHRLLSFDLISSSYSREMTVKPLQDLLLQEPELSQLARTVRSH